jgi:hypothetical protein
VPTYSRTTRRFAGKSCGFGVATGNSRLDDLRCALVPEREAPTFVFTLGHSTEDFSSLSRMLGTKVCEALDDLVRRLGVTRQGKGVTQSLKAYICRNLVGTEPPTKCREFTRRVGANGGDSAVPQCEESLEYRVLKWWSVRNETTTDRLEQRAPEFFVSDRKQVGKQSILKVDLARPVETHEMVAQRLIPSTLASLIVARLNSTDRQRILVT